MRSAALLSTLSLAALAVSARQVNYRKSHISRFHQRSSGYTLKDIYQGDTFFDGFDFFTGADPTGGLVDYVDESDAKTGNLAYVQSDKTVVMAVDNTTQVSDGGNRKSVRIQSKNTYSNGLIIADIYSMPHGCSVWPAYWMVGPDWPTNGEIDIIEGVNEITTNQMTVHTASGCTLDRTPSASTVNNSTGKVEAFTASVMGTTCASSASSNAGCGFSDAAVESYGHGFNMIAGNVFATLIESSGISIWRFPRGSIPADIDAQTPDPTSWGTPSAFWSGSACDISSHFNNMNIVFDTTLCGGWANSAFSSTCSGTCSAAVANASNFDYAQWKINYVAVYQ